MASDLIKLGGLWANKDRDGKTYLTGKLSPTTKILIFPNKFRETENQPTHIMYLSAVESQAQQSEEAGEDDAFFPDTPAPRRAAAPAPEDVPPPRATNGAPVPRRAQQAPPARRPMADDQYEEDLDDPFADDGQPQPQPRTGRRANF